MAGDGRAARRVGKPWKVRELYAATAGLQVWVRILAIIRGYTCGRVLFYGSIRGYAKSRVSYTIYAATRVTADT